MAANRMPREIRMTMPTQTMAVKPIRLNRNRTIAALLVRRAHYTIEGNHRQEAARLGPRESLSHGNRYLALTCPQQVSRMRLRSRSGCSETLWPRKLCSCGGVATHRGCDTPRRGACGQSSRRGLPIWAGRVWGLLCHLGEPVDRHRRLFGRLGRWEQRWASNTPRRALNDHYLALFVRTTR